MGVAQFNVTDVRDFEVIIDDGNPSVFNTTGRLEKEDVNVQLAEPCRFNNVIITFL